jgi:hypothetical protein
MSLLTMSWLMIAFLASDLAAVRQEPNLERRSELALENAGTALADAREAYAAGNLEKAQVEASVVEESVTLAYDSLTGSGKDPRRDPKFFKRAEMTTRQLLRRIDGVIESMSVQDRAILLAVRDRVSDIHDELLNSIMKKKR